MGDKNDVTKEFMSNNVFFADFCNYYIYNGEQRIQPDQANREYSLISCIL